MIRCKVCKEGTTHDRESSFYGFVHRWGPTNHKFVPEEYEVDETYDSIPHGEDD